MSAETTTLSEAIDDFLSYEDGVRGFSGHSVTAYRNDLAKLAAFVGADTAVSAVSAEDLRRSIASLSKQKYAAASINRYLAAVRSLFAYCRRFQYIESNPAEVIKTVKQPQHIPAFMTQTEVDALCAEPLQTKHQHGLWPARDHALFELFYSSGCRVSELAALTLVDIDADYRSAVVRGKGNKERTVFFAADAVRALRNYLAERQLRIAAERPVPALFVNQQGTALTTRGMRFIVARYSGAAGTKRQVSPHAFRHTFATAMLSGGADIRVVQELLGHASISTTQRYTHISQARLTQVYQKAHPHGGLRGEN